MVEQRRTIDQLEDDKDDLEEELATTIAKLEGHKKFTELMRLVCGR